MAFSQKANVGSNLYPHILFLLNILDHLDIELEMILILSIKTLIHSTVLFFQQDWWNCCRRDKYYTYILFDVYLKSNDGLGVA